RRSPKAAIRRARRKEGCRRDAECTLNSSCEPPHDPSESALSISCDDWPVSLSFLGGIALRFRELIIVFLSANFVSHRKRCHRSRSLLPARLPLSPFFAPLSPLLLRSPGLL